VVKISARFDREEWWPVLIPCDDCLECYDVEEQIVADYRLAMEGFGAAERALKDAVGVK